MVAQEKTVKLLALGCSSFLLSLLGHLLAGQCGGVVYLWAPAGLAVAVSLSVSLGKIGLMPVLLGVLLGRLACDPSLAGFQGGLIDAFSMYALGVFAKWLSRSFLKRLSYKNDIHFLAWLSRAGLLASLVPAALMYASDVILHEGMHPSGWLVFAGEWLGNTLGVLLFCPIVLILNRSAHLRLAERQDTVRAICVIGALAVLLILGNLFVQSFVQDAGVLFLFRLVVMFVILGAVSAVLGGLGRTVSVLHAVRARTIELEERLTHQLTAETALKQQEEDLSVTLQILGEAVIVTDANGNILKINRVAEDLTGWSQAQAVGERASAVFCLQNPNDSTAMPVDVQYPVTTALSRKETVRAQSPVRMVSRAGTLHKVSYITAPLLEKNKLLRGAVLVFREVSALENLQATIAENERRFRSIIERTPNAIVLLRDDTIEFVNPRALRLLGLSPNGGEHRVLGSSLLQWVAQGDHAALNHFRNESEEYHQHNDLLVTLKRYDAEDQPVRVSVGNLNAEGRYQFLIFKIVAPDFQNRFDANGFFNFSPDLVCIADHSGYFKQVNPAFVQALGWSQQELVSQPLISFVHADDVEATETEIHKLELGAPLRCFTNRCLCKNGTYLWLEWKALVAGNGVVFATARDVTSEIEQIMNLRGIIDQQARDLRLKDYALNALSKQS